MKNESVLLVVQVDMMPNPVYGSVMGICQWCRKEVWISPDGQKVMMDVEGIKVCCLLCSENLEFGNVHGLGGLMG